MSKKMMKRSLALGALMAFVITGSAMAMEPVDAPIVGLGDVNYDWVAHYVDGKLTEDDVTVTAGSNAVYICGSGVQSEVPDMQIDAKTISLTSNTTTGAAVILNSGDGSYGYLDIDFSETMILTGNDKAHGISNASKNGIVDIAGTGNFTLTAAENAIYARADGSQIKIDAINVTIESLGEDERTETNPGDLNRGHAIYAKNANSSINIEAKNDLQILVSDVADHDATNKTYFGKNAVKTSVNGSVTLTAGKDIYTNGTIQGNFNITATNGTLTIDTTNNKGNQDAGLNAKSDNSYLQANDVKAQENTVNVKNLIINSESMAVRADGANLIVNAQTVDLTSKDGGIYVSAYSNGGGVTVEEGAGSVTMNVSDSLTINAAGNGVSLASSGPSKNVNITGSAVVDITAGGNGVYTRGSNITADGYVQNAINISGSEVTITSEATDEAEEDTKGHAVFASGASINVSATDKVELNAVEGKNAIYSNQGNHGTNDPDGNQGKVVIGSVNGYKADVVVNGNITANDKSSVEVGFDTATSSLTGAVTTAVGAATKLTLNDGATWNVTGASNVSVIDGSDAKIKVEDAENAKGWVKVGDMQADKLTVATVTEDSDTDATLKALSEVAIKADGNTLAATHVQLQNAVYDKLVVKANELGNVVDKAIAQANINVSDMAALGLMSWRAETNDMNKRMGELRNANGEHGVWVRAVGGEDEYKSVEYDYTQYQLGYDEKLSTDPSWTVGVALSYTDGESKFAKGSGENENKGVAIYGSKLNADGSFIDLIAKYSRMENDFKTIGGMGDADYSTNGYSFSAEYGKRIQQGNGLWIEPQVELTYGRVADVDYVTARGMKVAQDSMESIVGRVGFSLGKDIKQGNVYARASYLYDFDGETSVSLGGQENLEQDLGGGWWEVGVGANINLSKATYIYADVEKTFGGEVDTNWQWNLGVRYSF